MNCLAANSWFTIRKINERAKTFVFVFHHSACVEECLTKYGFLIYVLLCRLCSRPNWMDHLIFCILFFCVGSICWYCFCFPFCSVSWKITRSVTIYSGNLLGLYLSSLVSKFSFCPFSIGYFGTYKHDFHEQFTFCCCEHFFHQIFLE